MHKVQCTCHSLINFIISFHLAPKMTVFQSSRFAKIVSFRLHFTFNFQNVKILVNRCWRALVSKSTLFLRINDYKDRQLKRASKRWLNRQNTHFMLSFMQFISLASFIHIRFRLKFVANQSASFIRQTLIWF